MQPWHIWFALALVLAAVEILTPGFVLICFSAGAAVAGLCALSGLSVPLQILGFAGGSFVAFVTIRPAMRRWALHKGEALPTNIDRLIGQKATVLEPTDDAKGLVKIGGESWSARSADGREIAAGSRVVVQAIEGNKVIVAVAPGA